MKAEIYETSVWLAETKPDVLKQKINQVLNHIGFRCLNFVEEYFEPQGYTAIWLLAESHLALHSFPEENRTYLQLSCCNQEKYHLFEQIIVGYF